MDPDHDDSQCCRRECGRHPKTARARLVGHLLMALIWPWPLLTVALTYAGFGVGLVLAHLLGSREAVLLVREHERFYRETIARAARGAA